MKVFKLNKNNKILFIVCVLFISLLLNLFTSVMNSRYKLKAGRESYKSVEEIRHRNESILSILNECIKAKSISNEELLVLYKNCNSISDSLVDLWSDYNNDGEDLILKLNKKTLLQSELPNQVYPRIENLVYEYLNSEMKNHNEKLNLQNKIMQNFTAMKDVSERIDRFYTKFYEENLLNLSEEKREKVIVRKDYWIDILKGINKELDTYKNYEFIIEE